MTPEAILPLETRERVKPSSILMTPELVEKIIKDPCELWKMGFAIEDAAALLAAAEWLQALGLPERTKTVPAGHRNGRVTFLNLFHPGESWGKVVSELPVGTVFVDASNFVLVNSYGSGDFVSGNSRTSPIYPVFVCSQVKRREGEKTFIGSIGRQWRLDEPPVFSLILEETRRLLTERFKTKGIRLTGNFSDPDKDWGFYGYTGTALNKLCELLTSDQKVDLLG